MKSTSLSPSSLFIICLCFIFYAAAPTLSLSLYEIVCHEAGQDVNACLDLLKTDSNATSANNYLDLSKSIVWMAFIRAEVAQLYFSKVGRKFPNNQAIGQCVTAFYPASIVEFSNSFGYVDENLQSAKNYVKIAGDEIAQCEKAIQNDKAIQDPTIHDINKMMSLLSEISLLAMNHLK